MKIFSLFGELALKGADQVKDEIKDTTEEAQDGSAKMSDAFKKIGGAIAAYLSVEAIKNFGKAIVDAASEVSAEVSAFEQIMGDYTENAKKKMGEVAEATGVVDSRLTPYMTSMTAKFKGLGYDIDTATTLASDGLTLASDAAAFWDKSLDDSMGALNSFINGSYEGGEAIGLFANDTQLAAYAVKTGLIDESKEWSTLEEKIKQATRLEYAKNMMKASGATGQAAKEAEAYANVQGNLTEKWRQFKALIGEPVLQNIVIPAMQVLSGLIDKMSAGYLALTTFINENKTAVTLIGIAIGTLTTAIIAFNIAQNAATIATKLQAAATAIATAATSAWGAVMAFVTSPITLVVVAIGALIAIIYLLVKNWDTVKAKTAEVWNAAKDIISKAWENIKRVVQVGILFIKEIFETAFELLTLPFAFIWENCKKYILQFVEAAKGIVQGFVTAVTGKFNAIKTKATEIFNAIKTVVTNIWNGIKGAITGAVEAARTAVSEKINSIKNTISGVFNAIKSVASNAWNAVKNAMTGPVNTAKDLIKGAIDRIKGFFNFSWSLPKLKLPHFSLKGEFSLIPPSVPEFSIDWYNKAMDNPMVLDKPTIFGAAGGKLLAGGESGPEIVAGRDTLMNMIREAAGAGNNALLDVLRQIRDILTDEDKIHDIIVNALTDGSFSVVLDGREVGRIVKKYA